MPSAIASTQLYNDELYNMPATFDQQYTVYRTSYDLRQSNSVRRYKHGLARRCRQKKTPNEKKKDHNKLTKYIQSSIQI